MSQNGLSAQSEQTGTPLKLGELGAPAVSGESVQAQTAAEKSIAKRYLDLQSAVRFPIQLPISVKSKAGERQTETQNISANGVLFRLDAEMPVGAPVDFTISLPASVLGSEADVQIDCRGRVARSFEDQGRRGVAVVIDEYRFERPEAL